MAAGYGGGGTAGGGGSVNIQEQTTTTIEEVADLFQIAFYPVEIREIFDSRIARIENLDLEISEVVRKTEREVGGFVTKKREFVYKDASFVKSGQDYHIHYTSDNEEYFMSGVSHNKMSRLIFPINKRKTNYGYYNRLNKQSQLYIESQATTPTDEDYSNGSFTRYFAQKANEKDSPVFEVSVDDYTSSTLYEYVSLTWYISGDRIEVYRANSLEVFRAQETLPNINRILTPFQYYRFSENLTNLERIRNKLAGFEDFLSNSNYNTTTQNPGAGADNLLGDGSLGGVCSLGPEYTTKEACIAAGGTWSESGLLDSDGNYTSADNADGQLYDANGNPLEDPDDVCRKNN